MKRLAMSVVLGLGTLIGTAAQAHMTCTSSTCCAPHGQIVSNGLFCNFKNCSRVIVGSEVNYFRDTRALPGTTCASYFCDPGYALCGTSVGLATIDGTHESPQEYPDCETSCNL